MTAAVARAGRSTTNFVETVGSMGILTGKTLVSAVAPPLSYGSEFANQFLFAIRLCWFPMIVASLCFSYGPSGIQVANFLGLFGALDRLGGVFVVAGVPGVPPPGGAPLLAGGAGPALCAAPRRRQNRR